MRCSCGLPLVSFPAAGSETVGPLPGIDSGIDVWHNDKVVIHESATIC